MSKNLKPCPFCGKVPRGVKSTVDGQYIVGCYRYKHAVETDPLDTEAEAVEAWNTRAERTCHNAAEYPIRGDFYECSACGYTLQDEYTLSYCPNCGAEMVWE